MSIYDIGGVVLCGAIGLGMWSPLEYAIHVALHRMGGVLGDVHHQHHRDPRRVFTTPLVWGPASAALGAVAVALLGLSAGIAWTAGLLLGFFRYEVIHFRAHFRAPRSPAEARRRAHHLAHHFRKPGAYFAVSDPIWDRVFRTRPADWRADYARVAARAPLAGSSNLGTLVPRRRPRG